MDIVSLATALYLEAIGGEMPGMNNVILKPKAIIGIDKKLMTGKTLHDINVEILYGNATTGKKTTAMGVQEVHGKWSALYPLYKDTVEEFSAGIYSSLSIPMNSYVPYTQNIPKIAYSDEENEIIKKETLIGADFNVKFSYDKISSSLHNVIFVYGKKIAPNLLTYRPLYGFDWRNNFYILGDVKNPKLKLSTNMLFWFAKKAATSTFNLHDGIGGTKREFDYNIDLHYYFEKNIDTYVSVRGYNNLNRGIDSHNPDGFKDGFGFGIKYVF